MKKMLEFTVDFFFFFSFNIPLATTVNALVVTAVQQPSSASTAVLLAWHTAEVLGRIR